MVLYSCRACEKKKTPGKRGIFYAIFHLLSLVIKRWESDQLPLIMAKDWAIKFYNSEAWQKTRQGYIDSVNNVCERCLADGRYVPGQIVHHKIYLTPQNINDPNISLNWENLEYLCLDCHNKEHMRQGITAKGLTFSEKGELIKL